MKKQRKQAKVQETSTSNNSTACSDVLYGQSRRGTAKGMFPSTKMGRMVSYGSLIEKDLLYILDFHPAAHNFQERQFSIECHHVSERKDVYWTPDFVVRTGVRTLLLECCSSSTVDTQATKDRHAAIRLWCATHSYGMEFICVTDREIRSGCYLSNVKLLTQYARHVVDPATRASTYSILAASPLQLSLGQVAIQLNPDFPEDAIPDLLHLAYTQEIYVPLHDWVVTGESLVCLPYQLPTKYAPQPSSSTAYPPLVFLDGYDAE